MASRQTLKLFPGSGRPIPAAIVKLPSFFLVLNALPVAALAVFLLGFITLGTGFQLPPRKDHSYPDKSVKRINHHPATCTDDESQQNKWYRSTLRWASTRLPPDTIHFPTPGNRARLLRCVRSRQVGSGVFPSAARIQLRSQLLTDGKSCV